MIKAYFTPMIFPGIKKYCYLNGKIIPISDATVSVNDIGLTRGFGISDVMRVYKGKPFLAKDHITRFFRSAELLGLSLPITNSAIEKILQTLIEKNNALDSQIRMILTGGNTVNGIRFDEKKPTFFILSEDFTPLPAVLYKRGGKLITYEFQRQFPLAKSTNYLAAVVLQELKTKANAIEILFVSNGVVTEASTSNIFMFKNGVLVTPKDDVLFGITRKFVLSLAKDVFKIQERKVSLKELLSADEVFLTATNKEILPITKIDAKLIGDGKVGKNTKKLIQLFQKKTGSTTMPQL